jgi:hypothetical protein
MTDVPAHIWAAAIETLKAVGPVLAAREQVEVTHGTAAEAAAIERLGQCLDDLEEAFDGLRTHYELTLKDL